MTRKLRFNSSTIHGGQEEEKGYGAVMPPIYQTSTYAQKSPGNHKGYEYSRTHNPTRSALERSISALENSKYGLAFASGLAAMDAIIKMFDPSDEIISVNDLYGGSFRLFTQIFKKYGLKIHFVNMQDLVSVEAHITKKTKLIWVETPTNPMMNVVDIKAISNLAKKHNILSAVDNMVKKLGAYLQRQSTIQRDNSQKLLLGLKYVREHTPEITLAELITLIEFRNGTIDRETELQSLQKLLLVSEQGKLTDDGAQLLEKLHLFDQSFASKKIDFTNQTAAFDALFEDL